MKLKKMNRIIMVLLLFTLILGQSSLAFAAKPGGGTTTYIPPTITQGESWNISVEEGRSVSITLSATGTNFKTFTWSNSTTPYSLITKSTPIISATQNQVTFTYKNTIKASPENFTVKVTDTSKNTFDIIVINVDVLDRTTPITTLNYVTLGDSVATGTYYVKGFLGIPSKKDNVSYAERLFNYYRNNYELTSWADYSADGDTTIELRSKLANMTPDMNSKVANADVITISIGANNILRAAKQPLGTYRFDSASKINWSLANQGKLIFNEDFKAILGMIKNVNSKAKILVMTVYNPYNYNDSAKSLDGSTSLRNQVNTYFTNSNMDGINDIINFNTSLGYEVVDIYSLFDSYAQKNLMGNITYFYSSLRDPHPNVTGHDLIFQAHLIQ